ncbi:MAG: DUF721 domain-containing protein [Gammaproteobacteria bacterium]|nr:DUF721 domain-containing protein [Gammaproteobacteria bacterium]
MKSFKKISGIIKHELSGYSDAPVSQILQSQLKDSWRKHAGDSILHTFPLLFQSGKLVIYCNSSAWSTTIRSQQSTLVSKLAADGLEVREIKVKVHPVSMSPAPKRKEAIRISDSTSNQIKSTASRLSHQGLKESLLKLAKRQN